LREKGDTDSAIKVLRPTIELEPPYAEVYLLLGDIYEKQGKAEEARAVYRQALATQELSRRDRYRLESRLQALPPAAESD